MSRHKTWGHILGHFYSSSDAFVKVQFLQAHSNKIVQLQTEVALQVQFFLEVLPIFVLQCCFDLPVCAFGCPPPPAVSPPSSSFENGWPERALHTVADDVFDADDPELVRYAAERFSAEQRRRLGLLFHDTDRGSARR